MSKLALLGGQPVFEKPLLPYSSIGQKEIDAVTDVMHSGCLSGFYGSWEDGFLGGPVVQRFEQAWSTRFGTTHTVSVNSNTSGLYACMGAIGIGPGDEVIVPATTMSATAMAPLIYGGIPVFSDLEEDTFCLDIESVKANFTDKTRAIIAVNLFGLAASLIELRALCDERGIYLIEDNAQAMLGTQQGRMCGTIGHIGVFSLNYHKHIHTGEGGMCTTDDADLATRLQMIRNHAEAVAGPAGVKDLTNLIGFNFRMTEMSAAVGLAQLEDIDLHVGRRVSFGQTLSEGLGNIEGIKVPFIRENCEHAYYNWMARYDESAVGVSRKTFVKALQAEGFPCFEGYVKPLYHLPIFKERVAIGSKGFPFTLTNRSFGPEQCPVAERLYEKEFIGLECCAYDVDADASEMMVTAFRKVYSGREELAASDADAA